MEYKKHFIYKHIRLDKNEVFYIGVGTKAKKSINSKLHNVIYKRAYNKTGSRRSKIWKDITNKSDYIIEILEESNDYQFLLNKEIALITSYGRIDLKTGTLANLTNGGEGVVGIIHTKERNEKISLGNKGKIRSQIEKDNIGARFKKRILKKTTGEVFDSIGDAAKSASLSYNALAMQLWSCTKNCKFKYEDDNLNYIKKIESKYGRGETGKKVKYIFSGETFNTIKEACHKLNINYFSKVKYKVLEFI